MKDHVQEQVRKLPREPGVYRYYDKDGQVLYIGKAKNLRNRVSSYFVQSKTTSARLKLLVRKIDRIEYTIVPNEKDAFLLENALIKQYQPRYNIQLKDDKSFPYIVIVNEHFPRIFLTRQKRDDGSEYFGPFTSVKYVRGTLEMIKSLYPIRSCALNLNPKVIHKRDYKVCLEYHLKNCLGPCELKQNEEQYGQNIQQIRQILMGKTAQVKARFREEMDEAAGRMEFEEAADIKKKLTTLEQYEQRSAIVHPRLGNLHVFGRTQVKDKAYVHYFQVDNGTIVSSRNLILKSSLEESSADLLSFAIEAVTGTLDGELDIILPEKPSREPALHKYHIPQRGEKKKLLELATRNALLLRQNEESNKPLSRNEELLAGMRDDLHLSDLPFHIECFDNSNLQGSHPVASMVVFKNGKPSKSEYRHYNIKTVDGPDDFASMEEVVLRRYKRLLEEDAPLPQLVVIDGGKGQLSSAYKSLETLGLTGRIQLIAIAKRLEELYYPNDELPFSINKRSPTLRVLQHLRNEAHRFAIGFHRDQRSRAAFKSSLSEIKGIGDKTTKELIKHFKSVKRIMEASKEELEEVVGKSKGGIVYEYFHGNT
jgi:excinuclease ABC subunit C